MNPIPYAQLHALLAVARTQSFSGAARELGISRSAISQSIRHLEKVTRAVLVARTTRSVSLTDAGRKLVDAITPAFAQTSAALAALSAPPGEVSGLLRLTVPRAAFEFIIRPVLPVFRKNNPRIEVELVFDDARVDIVAGGFDAGIRLSEFVERDMISVRLTEAFRFVVVGSPGYLAKHGTPKKPEDLLQHDCIGMRLGATKTLYAWELERGRRTWRIPVRGSVVSNDGLHSATWAGQGLGLAYVMEPLIEAQLKKGTLRRVLDDFAATVPGFYLYFPSRSQRSLPLRRFIETVREHTGQRS